MLLQRSNCTFFLVIMPTHNHTTCPQEAVLCPTVAANSVWVRPGPQTQMDLMCYMQSARQTIWLLGSATKTAVRKHSAPDYLCVIYLLPVVHVCLLHIPTAY
jgi:hypothetical protein